MFCFGNIAARRRTRLSSVPTTHELPSGAAAMVWMIRSVEPTTSADSTTSYWHSGCTITLTSGMVARAAATASSEKRPCTEQCPRHKITRAARTCSRVSPPAGLCGSNTTQSCRERPSSRTAVLRPRCWSGRNSTFASPPTPPCWSNAHCIAVFALLDVQIVPCVLDLGDCGHVRHGTSRGQVGQHDVLMVCREDVGRLRHEVHAAEDDVCRLRACGRFLGKLEAVARHIGELNDLVALVVVAEDEDLFAEGSLGDPCTFDQTRLRGRRQLATERGVECPGELATLTQDEQGQRSAVWLVRCGAHALIVCP